jgi:hypothetical protein
MAEHEQDLPTCGICFEPFRNGEFAVQVARWGNPFVGPHMELSTKHAVSDVREKFWAHPVCLFSIAREAEGPASTVAATPPEPTDDGDEALPPKRKPK